MDFTFSPRLANTCWPGLSYVCSPPVCLSPAGQCALDNSPTITIMLTRDEGGLDVQTAVKNTWRIPDRGRRKEEITRAFWRMEPSRAGDKQTAYEMALRKIGISTPSDLEILISVVQDAIMKAEREGLPTAQLEAFRAWLLEKRLAPS